MITTIFSKSRPFNYILIISSLILCFLLLEYQNNEWQSSSLLIIKKIGLLLLLVASLLLTNFISKRNGLSKETSFPMLFFLLFLILLPSTLDNFKLVASNFFVLLGFRKLISLQSLTMTKEKIFDASIWIFVATLFHFWSILYLLLLFFSIILHVSRDYRNWLLPYIALFLVSIVFLFASLIFNKLWIYQLIESAQTNFDFDYFTNSFQNISFSIFTTIAALFFIAQNLSLSSKPLILNAAYKKIIMSFLIGITIFLISPYKSNSVLVFTFMPLSVMAASYIEESEVKWMKETTVGIIIGLCLLSFFFQL